MIDEIISRQNFELVRDAIGSILLIELEAQKQKQDFDENINIFSERTNPIQNDELLTINLSLESGDFSNKTQKDSEGKTIYNIDIYTIGKSSPSGSGSNDSAFRLHKFIGMIRYILSHTAYRTLGLTPGFIGGSQIESFFIMDADLKQDSNYLKMARITFSVRINENQSMENGVLIDESLAVVKLDETDLGFVYKFKN